jgi:hypothetical protein
VVDDTIILLKFLSFNKSLKSVLEINPLPNGPKLCISYIIGIFLGTNNNSIMVKRLEECIESDL